VSTSAPRRSVDAIDRRVGFMFGLVMVLLLVGALRAAYLGTVRSGALRQAATDQQIQTVTVPALRGEITDRSGVPYAISEPAEAIYADPMLIDKTYRNLTPVAAALAPLIGQSTSRTLALLRHPRLGYLQLAADVSVGTADRIMALQVGGSAGINGIWDVPTERRVYPRGSELGQVIGWVGGDKGLVGLEYEFNKQLAGRAGVRKTVIDGQGQPIAVTTTKPVVAGENVRLTISAPLESEVQSVLDGVGAQYRPQGATAIVTDPQTDQILALANWPSLNLDHIPPTALSSVGGRLPAAEDEAVDFSYEPGSTFKAVTVSGALQDGLITPSTVIRVPPYLQADGHIVTDAETHGWENLSIAQILKFSSNIGADLIGQRLGAERFGHWVSEYGFGRPTGVALPGEQRGIVLQPSQYSGFSMYNLPFGQGISVTPMQMIQLYDTVADGGVLHTPQLIESIGGRRVPEPKGRRVVSAKVARELRYMLRGVLADGGTASGAAIPGYDMAGKTGTAQVAVNGQYSATKFVASFVGMVPASKPQLVVLVVVDDPQGSIYGGSVAAPAFQKIVGWAVPHFGIDPCPPHACPASAMHPAMPPTP
jgi:cell division protein FtsI (penicillin-binding protein 3)